MIEFMTPADPSQLAIRRQMDRILASPGFSSNQRLSAILRFVVENELSGRGDELKEIVIGVEVLGRPADYNPKKDSIVRAEAGRLRARLSEYYQREGKADPMVIELPRGGYVPVFRRPPDDADQPAIRRFGNTWILFAGVAAAFAIAAIALAWWR